MIQAELRRLHSPDAPDLREYAPDDPKRFGILVQAMIGPRGRPGEESFDFMVCTPPWLAEQLAKSRSLMGRHYLFVTGYDLGVIRAAITDLCEQAAGSDWGTIAVYLGGFGKWEFEDYVPAESER